MSQGTLPPSPRSMGPAQAFQHAMAFHGQRRLWEAEQLYKRVLKADDRHFGSLYQLGLLYLQQGKFEHGVRLFRRAVDADKNSAEACHHLAVALMAVGRPEEAVQQYERALVIRPDLAETHNNLGYALQTLGRTETAIAHYEKALSIRPGFPEAHNNLGNALHKLRQYEKAIWHYKEALATNPNYVEALNNLGNALVALGRHDEAMAHYETALAIKPDDAEAYNNLGNTLHMLGRSEEAITYHERALAMRPDDADFHNNLAQALHALGRLNEASDAFGRAIALTPGRVRYYWGLVNSKHLSTTDRHFMAMVDLARDMESLNVDEQIELHFALGKAFADLGDRERSFHHLLEGNSLKRRKITYDEAKELEQFQRLRTVFTAELMRGKQGLGDPSSLPVFILGMPRSGTTLVEQILASHPKVFGAGELAEVGRLVASIDGPDGTSFPEGVRTMSGERLHQLGASYLDAIGRLAPGAHRVTDKMPANFAYVGLIHLVLPNARIIHTCRDLRDTAFSCFSILWPNTQEYTCDLGELGRYCRAYEQLMEHWRAVLPEGAMLQVQYEDLVADFEQQARRIVAYCSLDWDERCSSFYETERSVRTASATQVRRPIYTSSIGRWRPYEPLLRPLLKELEGA